MLCGENVSRYLIFFYSLLNVSRRCNIPQICNINLLLISYWIFAAPTGLKMKNFIFCHTAFMCFVSISEQIATFAPCKMKRSVFITEMKSVYSAVRTGSLNKAVCPLSVKVSLTPVSGNSSASYIELTKIPKT